MQTQKYFKLNDSLNGNGIQFKKNSNLLGMHEISYEKTDPIEKPYLIKYSVARQLLNTFLILMLFGALFFFGFTADMSDPLGNLNAPDQHITKTQPSLQAAGQNFLVHK